MKIIIKTLQNKQLPLDVPEDIKIADLKQEIEKQHGFAADTQTLISKGKKLDDENKTIADWSIKENDFIIIMIQKPKPVAKPAEAKPEDKPVISPAVAISGSEQTATAQPVPQAPPVQPSAPVQPAPAQQAPPVDEEKVGNLMAFTGGSREMCI